MDKYKRIKMIPHGRKPIGKSVGMEIEGEEEPEGEVMDEIDAYDMC